MAAHKRTPPGPDQGAMLDTITEHFGDLRDTRVFVPEEGVVYPHEATVQETQSIAPIVVAAVDIREGLQAKVEELNHFADADRKQGFIDASHSRTERPKLVARFGSAEAVDAIAANMQSSKDGSRILAREAHAKALGTEVMVRAGLLSQEEADERLARSFSRSYRLYGTPDVAKQRDMLRTRLLRTLIILDLPPQEHPAPEKKPTPGETGEETAEVVTQTAALEELTTAEKLRAIQGDSRAGFIVPTNREKKALVLLDYIDNPRYPGGIHDHLREIADHQIGQARRQGLAHHAAQARGEDAVRSILYEYGDYLHNAEAETTNLQNLAAKIDDTPNPNLSLAELLGELQDEELDPASLIRFMDDVALMQGSGEHVPFAVLRSHANRAIRTGQKHKTIEDPYTAKVRRPTVEDYIEQRLQQLRVRDVRDILPIAIEDQQKRALFWRRALDSVGYEYRARAEEVLESFAA